MLYFCCGVLKAKSKLYVLRGNLNICLWSWWFSFSLCVFTLNKSECILKFTQQKCVIILIWWKATVCGDIKHVCEPLHGVSATRMKEFSLECSFPSICVTTEIQAYSFKPCGCARSTMSLRLVLEQLSGWHRGDPRPLEELLIQHGAELPKIVLLMRKTL